jgi:DNA-binding CsgD family transcriptional regulator
MKATYNGVVYELSTEEDIRLFQEMIKEQPKEQEQNTTVDGIRSATKLLDIRKRKGVGRKRIAKEKGSKPKVHKQIKDKQIKVHHRAECEDCGKGFITKRRDSRFCSKKCKQSSYYKISHKISSKSTPDKSGRKWSKEDDQYLLKHKNDSMSSLRGALGRRRYAIVSRLWFLKKNQNQTSQSFVLNDYHQKVLKYLSSGTSIKEIAKLLMVKPHTIYRTLVVLRKNGFVTKVRGEHNRYAVMEQKQGLGRYMIRQKGVLPRNVPDGISRNPLISAVFDFISSDKMDIARALISSSSRSKQKISISDCITYLGLTVGEAKAFIQDVFQQQKDLGYKVIIQNDTLVFQ